MASGGYAVKLFPGTRVPESYYCPLCKLLLRSAVQTSEGDRLCESCFKTIVNMPGHVCEDCGIKVDPDEFYPDIASRKEISKVKVLCYNTDQGCSWNGLLKDIDTHLEACEFKKVKCDLCHEGVLARYLEQHMANECPERTISCGYCSASVISKALQEHYGVCKNYPEDCPYCKKRIPRSEMDSHLAADCTHTRCSCGDVVERDIRREHLKDPNVLFDHLSKATLAVGQSEATIVMQETLKQHTSVLVDCQKEMRDMDRRLGKVEAEQSRQAAVLQTGVQSGPPAGKGVEHELFVIKQQVQTIMERLVLLEDRKNYDLPPLRSEGEEQFGGGGMSVHAKLKFLEEKILDVEKTANILSVHHSELELQLQASLASSFNGTFVWRIPDVPRRIREAKSGRVSSIYSLPFYTGRMGYKMCIRAYLNGDGIGENTHLSLFFVIMRGEYDPLLVWPFDHKFYPDIASRKEISEVKVLCYNTDQGCSWSGVLKDIDTYLEECGFKKVKCDLCHEGVLARYLKQHMANECPERTISCGYCIASVISKALQEHYGVCKNYPEDCPYCKKRIPRSEDFFQIKDEMKKLSQKVYATYDRVCLIDDNLVDVNHRLGKLEAERAMASKGAARRRTVSSSF